MEGCAVEAGEDKGLPKSKIVKAFEVEAGDDTGGLPKSKIIVGFAVPKEVVANNNGARQNDLRCGQSTAIGTGSTSIACSAISITSSVGRSINLEVKLHMVIRLNENLPFCLVDF